MKEGFEQNDNERGVSIVESKELMLKNSSFVKTVLMLFVILGHAVTFGMEVGLKSILRYLNVIH